MKNLNITIGPSNKLGKYDAHFLIKLAALLKNGFTMQQALIFLTEQYEVIKAQDKAAALALINSGAALSAVLKSLGFSKSIIMQVSFAEIHGEIITNLEQSGEYLNTRRKTVQKLIKTLQYPLVLVSIFIIMLVLLNYTVIPQFNDLYSAMQADKTSLVNILTFILNYLPYTALGVLIIIMLISVTILLITRMKNTKRAAHMLLIIPLVRTYFKYYVTYRFSREFGYFLNNGLEVKEIIMLLKTQTINRYLNMTARMLEEKLLAGISLSEAIEQQNVLDQRLAVFVSHGEYNSDVGKELIIYSEYSLENIIIKIENLTKKIQPVIFLILGLLIVCLYLVIVLPIFNMMSNIQ
ncbi:competence protein ComGB [Jeotgalicoccus aerolatus]|uniref:Competence protein ComGB n=1 Tax=Jeotgalicoccus aerolatus TaxID=709510 RepID=A0A1G8UT26_9STAP|nr:competence type IV pilus assembly protein ComGB [Jeotgalicoccus aerolatus]NMA81123.1 type II secretion system F family protein [Jeotgalicoccus aerolatus]SDJ56110.1 competence protein ComGB [Jeotgalicoccus aerolatus]HJG32982.1 type II secretion system F family protein [Jeotgalicoccus aerolatus]